MSNIPNQKPYKDLTPFDLALIQRFPFIEEDFDGINLYGILSKIKESLNNTIANEQIVTENQINLHNYVEDYFTNLDVQQEINNKLDLMVESGELTNIISSYITPYLNQFNDRLNVQDRKLSAIENISPIRSK
jgi:hypothetical protein